MEEKISPAEVLAAISGDATSTRWFRDTPHRWATASLPLAYAVACIEEVCRKSDVARDRAEAIRISASLYPCVEKLPASVPNRSNTTARYFIVLRYAPRISLCFRARSNEGCIFISRNSLMAKSRCSVLCLLFGYLFHHFDAA